MNRSFSYKAVQAKAKELRAKKGETGITPQTNKVLSKIPGGAIKAWYEDILKEAKEGWKSVFGRDFTSKDENFIYNKVLEAVAIEGVKADESDVYREIGKLAKSESTVYSTEPSESELEEAYKSFEDLRYIQEEEIQHELNLGDLSESDLIWAIIDKAKEMIVNDKYSIDEEEWKYDMFDRYKANEISINDLYTGILDNYADYYAAVANREGLDLTKRKDTEKLIKLDVIKTLQDNAAEDLKNAWERANPGNKRVKKDTSSAKGTFRKGW